MTYNREGTDVHIMAEALNAKFNERWRVGAYGFPPSVCSACIRSAFTRSLMVINSRG